MILRACTVCGALSDRARCRAHRPRDGRPSAAQRGYDARWRRTRARVLAERAVCAGFGCEARATEVHHHDGQGPLGPRGHDPTNLVALCKSCHSKVTAAQPAGWAAQCRTNERTGERDE